MMRLRRTLLVLLIALGALFAGAAPASAHGNHCLLAVHAGGIQPHLGCS